MPPRRRIDNHSEDNNRSEAECGASLTLHWPGVEYLAKKIDEKVLRPQDCSLCVTIHYPTHLDGLKQLYGRIKDRLHGHIGDQLFIYLPDSNARSGNYGFVASANALEGSALIELSNGDNIAFVGSHNWTEPALQGENMEASVRVQGTAGDKFFDDVRRHLAACRDACEPFDPDRIEEYKRIQLELFQKEKKAQMKLLQKDKREKGAEKAANLPLSVCL